MTNSKPIPQHVAIIMDGNGRWARSRGLPKIAGHRAGVASIEKVMRAAGEVGVKFLTFYTFSTENWKRPKEEVDALFGLIEEYVDKEIKKLTDNNIRVKVIGRSDVLPKGAREKLAKLTVSTKDNTGLTATFAINYGSRREITDACRDVAQEVLSGAISPEEITEESFTKHLYTAGIPDPDLLIRTSGEYRLSNFLLWQLSYAEVYVTATLWPDFGEAEFKKAIDDYLERERRYGG